MAVLRAMAPYALMVHGGLSRIRSMLNMMAGMAWKPLSSFTVSFSQADAGIGALSIEMGSVTYQSGSRGNASSGGTTRDRSMAQRPQ